MPQFGFGSGSLFGVTTDTPPQAALFGTLQEVSIEFSGSMKELTGQNQFPVAIGRGKSKIDCKAKFAQMRSDVFSKLYFGLSAATGQTKIAVSEPGEIPAAVAYTVTVTHSATWVADLGVFDMTTGLPMKRVSAPAAAGEYSVAAGVYTFDADDADKAVAISYTYTAATGKTITITNQLLGLAPSFSVYLDNCYQSTNLTVILNKCVSNKLTLPTKLEDFVISEFDFSAMADNTNTIGVLSLNE